MNEQENKRNMMYGNIQAVTQLNKVPGFDPLQFLRPSISEKTQEKLLKLDLRYQKLWFRLAHPQGRMKLTALRITDQMAIFEAKVFLDRSDSEPVSSLVASLTRQNTLNYIKEVQDTALSAALENAGFGLQFADVRVGRDGEPCGSVVPAASVQVSEQTVEKEMPAQAVRASAEASHTSEEKALAEMPKTPQATPVAVATPVPKAESKPAMQSVAESLPVSPSGKEAGLAEQLPAAPAVEPEQKESLPMASAAEQAQKENLPMAPAAMPAQATQVSAESKTLPFVRPAAEAVAMAPEPVVKVQSVSLPAEASAPVQEQKAETAAAPRYTADMAVDDITALMTEEEAREVKVDTGICNGWTIGQVADQRTPSLKYYLYGYKGNNNILRAAAKVMLDSLTEQKAG
ncbi:MAG: hypothetical protein LUG90_22655 [Clostridiaceae bacterium]|nr:hypothetical protein [Clostridiaceae bacterium]